MTEGGAVIISILIMTMLQFFGWRFYFGANIISITARSNKKCREVYY